MKWRTWNLLGAKQQVFIGLGVWRCLLTAEVDSVNIPHAEASDACRDGGDQYGRNERSLHVDVRFVIL
jgi:hypothetical protein